MKDKLWQDETVQALKQAHAEERAALLARVERLEDILRKIYGEGGRCPLCWGYENHDEDCELVVALKEAQPPSP